MIIASPAFSSPDREIPVFLDSSLKSCSSAFNYVSFPSLLQLHYALLEYTVFKNWDHYGFINHWNDAFSLVLNLHPDVVQYFVGFVLAAAAHWLNDFISLFQDIVQWFNFIISTLPNLWKGRYKLRKTIT